MRMLHLTIRLWSPDFDGVTPEAIRAALCRAFPPALGDDVIQVDELPTCADCGRPFATETELDEHRRIAIEHQHRAER